MNEIESARAASLAWGVVMVRTRKRGLMYGAAAMICAAAATFHGTAWDLPGLTLLGGITLCAGTWMCARAVLSERELRANGQHEQQS